MFRLSVHQLDVAASIHLLNAYNAKLVFQMRRYYHPWLGLIFRV